MDHRGLDFSGRVAVQLVLVTVVTGAVQWGLADLTGPVATLARGLGFVWAALACLVILGLASDRYRPRLRRLFAPRRGGALYRRMIVRPALWPRDWRMFDWALRLAVAYPLVFALLNWGIGFRALDIGGVQVLPAPANGWQVIATFCVLAIVIVTPKLSNWAGAAARKGFIRKFSGRLDTDQWAGTVEVVAFAVAVAFAFAFAVAFAFAFAVAFAVTGAVAVAVTGAVAVAVAGAGAGAGAGAFAFAVAFAVAVAGAVAGAFAGAVAGAGAGAFAFAVAGAVESAEKRGKGNLAYPLFTLFLSGLILAAFAAIDWSQDRPDAAVLLLFLGLLPLINAVFDYLSYALTFWLLRAGFWQPRLALLAGVVDLSAAFVLLIASGAGVILAIAAANQLAGVEVYAIPALLDGLRHRPGDYLWLYAMLFSTLLPTALHLAIGFFSLGAWGWPGLRAQVVGWIDDTDVVVAGLAPLGIAGIWTLTLALAAAVFWGLWALLSWAVPQLYDRYLNWLEHLAGWVAGLA